MKQNYSDLYIPLNDREWQKYDKIFINTYQGSFIFRFNRKHLIKILPGFFIKPFPSMSNGPSQVSLENKSEREFSAWPYFKYQLTEGNRLALYFLQNERISEAFCDSHNYSFGCCKNVHHSKKHWIIIHKGGNYKLKCNKNDCESQRKTQIAHRNIKTKCLPAYIFQDG